MLNKLLKSRRTNTELTNEAPTPDLSRIFKPGKLPSEKDVEPVEVERHAQDAVKVEEQDESVPEVDREAWLKRDVDTLKSAFDGYAQRVSSKDARRQLFIASHNLRGTAEPFGNPVLGRLAASLCNLLENSADDEPVVALANLHVEAMRAAAVTGPSAASDELAQTVCVALEDQVQTKVQA